MLAPSALDARGACACVCDCDGGGCDAAALPHAASSSPLDPPPPQLVPRAAERRDMDAMVGAVTPGETTLGTAENAKLVPADEDAAAAGAGVAEELLSELPPADCAPASAWACACDCVSATKELRRATLLLRWWAAFACATAAAAAATAAALCACRNGCVSCCAPLSRARRAASISSSSAARRAALVCARFSSARSATASLSADLSSMVRVKNAELDSLQ